MSDSEDKAEATAVKAEDAAEKKEAEKNGDAKAKAEDDDAKKSDDDAKKEPVADVKKEEKKDDDDGKEDAKKVTSAELRKRITAILKEADLEKTSAKKVGELLEGDGIGKMILMRFYCSILRCDRSSRRISVGKISHRARTRSTAS